MTEAAAQPARRHVLAAALLLLAGGGPVSADAGFVPAEQPIAYVAQVESGPDKLRAGGSVVFHGQFERKSWGGNLRAYRVDGAGRVDGAEPWWPSGVADMLDQQNPDTGRLIATLKDDGTRVAFRWDQLSQAQRADLGGRDMLDFLRGDRRNEATVRGKSLRRRSTVLGDIVHSRPFLVRDNTDPTLFVGANDGMLHAINASCTAGAGRSSGCAADGGKERWAYVPSMLIPGLKSLAVEPYQHSYYVDGQINVKTIAGGSKRVLVGGLGAGGKGLFALDITANAGLVASSEADVAKKILWEITPATVNHGSPVVPNAYVNLGYTFGAIMLARVAQTDAVIVGNGYNDGAGVYARCQHASPAYASCGGDYQAYLYVINAVTGQLIQAIKAGSSGSASSPNGLSSPAAVDRDGDGAVDTVYAGDLHGTLWKFDLAHATASALLVTSPAQAITATPAVGVHPGGGYMVNFATGRMLTPSDMDDDTTHYAYGIWDGAPPAHTELLVQTLRERDYAIDGVAQRVRSATAYQPLWRDGPVRHKGWRVALLGGERVVGEGSFIESGRFYFNAVDPTARGASPGGTGTAGGNTLVELDYLSGGSAAQPFLDLSGKGRPGDADRIRYEAGEPLAPGRRTGDPIMGTDGVPVGRSMGTGALSQPVLARRGELNEVLFNHHADPGLAASATGSGSAAQVSPPGIRSGGRERGLRARTGRISWRELTVP